MPDRVVYRLLNDAIQMERTRSIQRQGLAAEFAAALNAEKRGRCPGQFLNGRDEAIPFERDRREAFGQVARDLDRLTDQLRDGLRRGWIGRFSRFQLLRNRLA